MGYLKLKPKWVETDIPKETKIKLWRIMRDNPTYTSWEKGVAGYEFSKEEDWYIRKSRDTHRALKNEITKMPAEEVLTLPPDLQKWIAELRPELSVQLKAKPSLATEKQEEHRHDLAEIAKKLSLNLERFSPSEIYPKYIARDLGEIEELEDIDDYLATCLLSHMKAEFPELFNIGLWQEVYRHSNKRELYQKLNLVAHRRTFEGTCDICKDWQ